MKLMKKAATAAVIVAALTLGLAPAAVAQDEWHFGLGTGVFGLNVDGDMGLETSQGTVILDASMTGDEVRELLETAFGLGGYAAKGKWVLQYSAAFLELGDSISGATPGGIPAAAGLTFTASGAEFTTAYRFALKGKHAWSVVGGLRYTKHEIDFDLDVGAVSLMRDIDQDWTDVLVGLSHGTQISDKWSWSNRINAGFGDSEGTYFLNSSFDWRFAEHWSLGLYGQNTSIEFENDSPGDPDYYLYDANEFGAGASIIYHF